MTTMVWVYLGYLAACILITVLVAKTLREHGPAIMAGKDANVSPLIKAKTHLMVVGFYLLTLGLIGFALRIGGDAIDATTAIEVLSSKIGGMVLAIGCLHFLIFGSFSSLGKSHENGRYSRPTAELVEKGS